jgi:3-hydroxy-9,10-secoandrosta-1,3,5(10)-triene-9,17-dione monooxygenase
MNEAADLLRRARELAPALVERAPGAEKDRQLPAQTLADFRREGLLRIMQPRRYGGYELGLDVLVDCVMAISAACGSSGWCLSLLSLHNWVVGLFASQAQEEVFGADDGHAVVTIALSPTGSAQQVAGGYQVTGRWGYGTGINHAGWVAVTALLQQSGGGVRPLCCLVPVSEVTVCDTWRVAGLSATGSHDVEVKGVFVPHHRVLDVGCAVEGRGHGANQVGSLYRLPLVPVLCFAGAAPALGIARGVIELFEQRARGRVLIYAGKAQAKHAGSQMRLARAVTAVAAADALMRVGLRELAAGADEGGVGVRERGRFRMYAAHIVATCQQTVAELYTAAGSGAVFHHSPLQRAFRDIHTLSTHAALAYDESSELYGGLRLGIEPRRAML